MCHISNNLIVTRFIYNKKYIKKIYIKKKKKMDGMVEPLPLAKLEVAESLSRL
jgi:hypothetical protein